MTQINAYLHFDGKCREAMEYYKECLGGDLTFLTVGESPMASQMPESGHRIMHSSLTNGPIVLLASDMNVPEGNIKGNNMSLCLDCTSEEDINKYFKNLSAEGKVQHPLGDMFWGGLFGALEDKYGMNWVLNYDKTAKQN